MHGGDFYAGESDLTLDKAVASQDDLVTKPGETIVLKSKIRCRPVKSSTACS
jgi:monomeric isocitrate dehydrogenase